MKKFEEIAEELINKPQTIAIISDVNQGKSMLNYNILKYLTAKYNGKIKTFGLRKNIEGETKIHTTTELEECRSDFIVLDEFDTLFNLSDRREKRNIEKTLRLINHTNNILMLIGLPRNFNKFISADINKFIFLSCQHKSFINGSRAKEMISEYSGYENGSKRLNLELGEAIYFDGIHYHKFSFDYLPEFDTKTNNESIFVEKQDEDKNVPKNVPEKKIEKMFQEKTQEETDNLEEIEYLEISAPKDL